MGPWESMIAGRTFISPHTERGSFPLHKREAASAPNSPQAGGVEALAEGTPWGWRCPRGRPFMGTSISWKDRKRRRLPGVRTGAASFGRRRRTTTGESLGSNNPHRSIPRKDDSACALAPVWGHVAFRINQAFSFSKPLLLSVLSFAFPAPDQKQINMWGIRSLCTCAARSSAIYVMLLVSPVLRVQSHWIYFELGRHRVALLQN